MTDRKNPDTARPEGEEISLARRSALLKLGLATVAVYAAPALLTLSEAEAGDRSSGRSSRGRSGRRSRKTGKRTRRRTGRRTRRSRRSRRSS